jgi:[glutamine synthetase] adenylyltransferase / [glutamine synthetase]-adenylyl-L-tyrosine phosphorylase
VHWARRNVSSDLDLVFVFREEGQTTGRLDEDGSRLARSQLSASEFMHRLARRAVALLSEITEDGFVFRVDTRLRPNGDSGPLVVPLSMLEQYFYAQGREWERFAWLKGRVIADSGLAGASARRGDEAALNAIVTPFVFRRYLDFNAFAALRDLHALIRSEVHRRDLRHEGSYDVKLGRGGIREIEFTAQLFQIVRGGRDPGLRDPGTVKTLQALGHRRLLQADDVQTLIQAYQMLRRTEHALQFREDAQTHRLPADEPIQAEVAAMLGLEPAAFRAQLEHFASAVERIFDDLLHGGQAPQGGHSQPTQLQTPLQTPLQTQPPTQLTDPPRDSSQPNLYSPPPAAPTSSPPQGGLSPDQRLAIEERIGALKSGARYRSARPETRAAIDQLMANPAVHQSGLQAVGAVADLMEAVSGRGGYIALLAQYPQALARVLRMVGRARWAAQYLIQHPIVLDELLDGQLLEPVDYVQWQAELDAGLAGAVLADGTPDVERQMDLAREAHHAQVFRLLAQDLEGLSSVERLSDLLSELADRTLESILRLLWAQLRKRFRQTPQFAVIAYGRLGGKELGYASDLDLVFVYDDDDPRAAEAYAQLGKRLSGWLSTRTAAGLLFEIDLRLRPNGNAGLLVSSLKALTDYQLESAWVWEHQALTRARFAAGDAQLGARFEALRRQVLVMPRDPARLAAEVVAMRRKMHEGHPNRSALFDLKHDPGGMVDIEFLVQYLVLLQGARHPELLDNAGNIALLGRAAQAGLIDSALAEQVANAYRHYRRTQHMMRLNDAQYVRVDPGEVSAPRAAVQALWHSLLGTAHEPT